MKKRIPLIVLACILSQTQFSFSQSGVKRILLEEFSTAPCGFCPEGDIFAQQIISNHPQVIWVTHHAGFGIDSMTIAESSAIAGAFTTFAPGACIDRMDIPLPPYTIPPYIAISRQKWDSICVAHLNDPPVVDINIINNYDSVTRILNCTVDASFITSPATGDLRLNLFLYEDSVVGFGNGYDQTNYFNSTPGHPFYNAGDPIVGYVHHHVMRKVPSGTWGMAGIIPAIPAAGSSYSHTFNNISISSLWKDNDIYVVAFVSYYNASAYLRTVINSNQKWLKDATGTTGIIIEGSENNIVNIFPNPATDKAYLSGNLSSFKKSGLLITNTQGQNIRSFELDNRNFEHQFSVQDLPDGIYFYKIVSDNVIHSSGKLVVIN